MIYPTGDSYCFQFNSANDVSWIHSDVLLSEIKTNPERNHYAAVIFLTPDPPIECGTSIYTHNKYNYSNCKDILKNNKSISRIEEISNDIDLTSSDLSKWKVNSHLSNKYNRCVIYNSSYYHQSNNYFGKNIEDCRLIQVVFFYTIDNDENKSPDIVYNNIIKD